MKTAKRQQRRSGSVLRKQRADSILQTLPEVRQDEIGAYYEQHTQKQTVTWLQGQQVAVSTSSLARFYESWKLRQEFKANAEAVRTLIELSLSAGTGWTPEQVEAIGHAFFTELAVRQRDSKLWEVTQRLALRRDSIEITESKFKESLRTKLEAGLDELAEAFKSHPEAMRLYQQARELIEKETR